MKKRTKSKKSSQATAAADQDIAVLLTTLVQKLASFEAKIDTVLSRISSQPPAAPRQQQAPAPAPERRREPRPMHKAVCADCGKDCEVPFRPSAGRPVYCKECFAARKSAGTFRPGGDRGPKESPPAAASSKPVKKKKRPAKKSK